MASRRHNYPLKLEDLKGKGICIATPCYGNSLTGNYVLSLVHTITLLHQHQINYEIRTLGSESIISKARNTLVSGFLDGKMDYLMFIDADMSWNGEAILDLMLSDKDMCAVAGPRKMMPLNFCLNMRPYDVDGESRLKICSETGMLSANEVGTGFMMMKRSVLEKLKPLHDDNWYNDPALQKRVDNFFETKIINGEFWSEDYIFCKKWRALGGEVWIDPNVVLGHVGSHVYQGAYVETMSNGGENAANNSESNGNGSK